MSQRKSVRAIIINSDKLLVMKRNKFGAEYYTLIGGGIEIGEDPGTALHREVQEETGLKIGGSKPVFIEQSNFYGVQFIYLCEYVGGDPRLDPHSEEAAITAMGKNTYEPMWMPLSQISQVAFRSLSVAEAILDGVARGFPNSPQELAWKAEAVRK